MATPPVFFPLWPRPGVSETLEWMTDVIVTENGAEERTEVRTSPRQAFQFSYYVSPERQARIDNIVYGGRTLQWQVPVWPQVQNLGAVASGLTVLPCETRYSEFRAGGEVMLWDSPEHYQVVTATVTGDDELTLDDPTEEFDNAWLAPVRRGHLLQNPARQLDGRKSVLTMAFVIDDNAELVPDAPDQYLGADVYFDPGLLDGLATSEQIAARVDTFDERLGQVDYLAPWINNRPVRIHRMMGETPEETWAIREWLHRRAGRSRAFWQPSFEGDLRVNDSGAITGSLSVYPDDYEDFAAARVHVAIEHTGGWLTREITNTIDLGPTELQLVFDTSLGGIQASSIRRVCYLGLKRLDTDRVEINWIGGQVAVAAVNTMEIEP